MPWESSTSHNFAFRNGRRENHPERIPNNAKYGLFPLRSFLNAPPASRLVRLELSYPVLPLFQAPANGLPNFQHEHSARPLPIHLRPDPRNPQPTPCTVPSTHPGRLSLPPSALHGTLCACAGRAAEDPGSSRYLVVWGLDLVWVP